MAEQTKAVGHAVRAGYMYSAMADIAFETQDESLVEACKTLWTGIEGKRSYVSGAVGGEDYGEAFTFDYDLPNDTIYGETCAAIALAFFSHRMLLLEMDARYSDMLERVLFNSIISGISLDGTRFFYVNPMEVWPQACETRRDMRHVKTVRQKWYGCACCPPNIARTLMSLGRYVYTQDDSTVYAHLYASSETMIDVAGVAVCITQETDYPWDGEVSFTVQPESDSRFTMALRIPGWCSGAPSLSVNGEELDLAEVTSKGYAYIDRLWRSGDEIRLRLPMDVRVVRANPAVRENIGKACVFRGPLLYCIEEVDNGKNLHNVFLPAETVFTERKESELLGGVVTLQSEGFQVDTASWAESLYNSNTRSRFVPRQLEFVPYYSWCNRTPGEMYVWLNERL